MVMAIGMMIIVLSMCVSTCAISAYLPVALEVGIFVFWSASVRSLGSFAVVVVLLAPKARFWGQVSAWED